MSDLQPMRARVCDAVATGIDYIEMHVDTYRALLDCAEAAELAERCILKDEPSTALPHIRDALAQLEAAP